MPAKKLYRITLPGHSYDIEATSAKAAWKDYCELTGCKSIHTPQITLVSDTAFGDSEDEQADDAE